MKTSLKINTSPALETPPLKLLPFALLPMQNYPPDPRQYPPARQNSENVTPDE